MGRWRRVMWCSVCMPRECVLIISSRAWWWCGAGRAGGLSFSRSLRRRAARQGVGVSPGSGARGAQEGRRRVGGRITRKWCAGSEVAAGRPLGGRRSLLLRWPGLLCGDARAPTSFVRSLLPPASCLLPRRRGWLAVSVEREHQSLSLFDLPSPARLACWRAVTRKCARRSEMKGGRLIDRCIEASQ